MSYTVADLLKTPFTELDAIFGAGEPGPIPAGEAKGTAIIAPDTAYSPVIAGLINHFAWQGKVFNPATGELLNKILPVGWPAVAAKVYSGSSWFDQKDCVVLDYSTTSVVAHLIRDEIRLIGPGFYLGKVYWQSTPIFHFTLQF